MKNLIKLQMRNVFKSKYFYVCLALSILMSVGIGYIGGQFIDSFKTKAMPQVIDVLKNEVSIVSIVYLVLFACFDFNEGTTKNIIARGYSKNQLLFSKYIVGLFSLFLMIIVMVVLSLILFSSYGMGYDKIMPLQIINSIFDITAHVIFFITLAFLLEKYNSAIIACLFIPNIIPMILTLVDTKSSINLSKMWLDGVSTKFIKDPTWPHLGWTILFYAIYIVIFIFIGTQILNRKEIK